MVCGVVHGNVDHFDESFRPFDRSLHVCLYRVKLYGGGAGFHLLVALVSWYVNCLLLCELVAGELVWGRDEKEQTGKVRYLGTFMTATKQTQSKLQAKADLLRMAIQASPVTCKMALMALGAQNLACLDQCEHTWYLSDAVVCPQIAQWDH